MSECRSEFDESEIVRLRARLLSWYESVGRDLPWRRTRDPYAIWVSEIMLQQTQVKTVIPYYGRWLAAFPTVHELARADLQNVLKLWEGLGYYARARNLHAAASIVVRDYGSRFPETLEAACALPGIGRSTAGAILSSAYDQCQAILDANVRRVLSRLYADSPSLSRVWERSAALLAPDYPRNFNQAIMDLGATVCTARSPLCLHCPWRTDCRAYRTGEPERFGPRLSRPRRGRLDGVCLLIVHRGEFLLVRRPPRGLLGGLWEFPYLELPAGYSPQAYVGSVFAAVEIVASYGSITHEFTHRLLSAQVYEARWLAAERALPPAFVGRESVWVPREAWANYPMPGFVHKVIALWSAAQTKSARDLFSRASENRIISQVSGGPEADVGAVEEEPQKGHDTQTGHDTNHPEWNSIWHRSAPS